MREEADEHRSVLPRPLDLARLAGRGRAPPRHWFRPDWLGPGVTLVAGAGGSGKSTLLQHEVTAGASGRPYFAEPSEDKYYRALLWNCEDSHDEMWRRQEQLCDHEQIELATGGDNLHLVSRVGCENALMEVIDRRLYRTPLFDELYEQVNDLRIDVLGLDNAAQVFLGDHDNRTEVTQFINALSGLVTDRPFSVVIAGHVARAQGLEFTGSVAWENAVRMRWFLGTKLPDQKADDGDAPDPHVRYLCKRKSNYTARDYVRMTMRKGVLVPDQPPSHVGGLVQQLDERKAEDACVAGYKSLIKLNIYSTDSPNTADYLPKQLVSKGLHCGYAKKDLERGLNRLMGRGTFVRGFPGGTYGNRTKRPGLVLVEGHQ